MANIEDYKYEKLVELPSLKDWGNDAWRKKAACRGFDTNLFFPKRYSEDGLASISDGRIVCASCTVRKECLEFAMDNNINHGLYGGLAPKDRRTKSSTVAKDGSMLLSTVLIDFRHVFGANRRKMTEDWVLTELSRMLRLSKDEVKQMIEDPSDYVLPSDGSTPYKTHL